MKLLRKDPLALGVGGAILASMCCATPVALVSLGLATSSLVLAWLNLKPIFLAASAAFLIGGVVILLVRSRRSCSRAGFRRRLWLYPLVTLTSFAIGYWLLMDFATPRLYAQIYSSDRAAVARSGWVVESSGKVVALHRATFKIYMGCEGCASTLRTVFLGLPGVHAAAIDIHHKTTSVLYDPTRINAKAIQAKIPYPWYYTPHLSRDIAMAAPSQATVVDSSMLVLIGVIAGLLAMTSVGVWTTSRHQPVH
jgi:copper chaperone CopZ